jgi:hypothetical protein
MLAMEERELLKKENLNGFPRDQKIAGYLATVQACN